MCLFILIKFKNKYVILSFLKLAFEHKVEN